MISYDYLQVADYFGNLISLDWVEDTQSKIELADTPSLLLTATDKLDKDLRHIIKATATSGQLVMGDGEGAEAEAGQLVMGDGEGAEATASQLVMGNGKGAAATSGQLVMGNGKGAAATAGQFVRGDGKGVILFKKSYYNLSSSNLEITCFTATNQLNIYLKNNVVNDTLNKDMLITGVVTINLPEYYSNTQKHGYDLRIPLNLFVLKKGIYSGQPSLIKAEVYYDYTPPKGDTKLDRKDILIYLAINTYLQNDNCLAIQIKAYEVYLDLRWSLTISKSQLSRVMKGKADIFLPDSETKATVMTDLQISDGMQGYSFKPIKFSNTTTSTVTPTVSLAEITVLSLDII
jgi:hypothetical protein